jgi:hypothetical protein
LCSGQRTWIYFQKCGIEHFIEVRCCYEYKVEQAGGEYLDEPHVKQSREAVRTQTYNDTHVTHEGT